MPLRSFLKINGVNGDATADAFDGSFSVDDIGAQTPSGTPQTFSFDVKDLKTSAAVSSDIVLSDIASNDSASSAIASSAGLSAGPGSGVEPAAVLPQDRWREGGLDRQRLRGLVLGRWLRHWGAEHGFILDGCWRRRWQSGVLAADGGHPFADRPGLAV